MMGNQKWVLMRVIWVCLVIVHSLTGCQEESTSPEKPGGETTEETAAEADSSEPNKTAEVADGLPEGWTLVEEPSISRQQTAAIGRKLGGAIQELVNSIYSVDGTRFQVNTITCAGPGDASRIAASLRRIHGGAHFRVLQDKHQVLEFVTEDPRLVESCASPKAALTQRGAPSTVGEVPRARSEIRNGCKSQS